MEPRIYNPYLATIYLFTPPLIGYILGREYVCYYNHLQNINTIKCPTMHDNFNTKNKPIVKD